VGLTAGSADRAEAFFGDRCYGDLQVGGTVQGTMTAARAAASSAWEARARRQHGTRFANWYYSADRSFDCSWNDKGNRIRCVAIAKPCGTAN
jgi:hypothetical protein